MAAPYPPITLRGMTLEQRSQALSHKIAHTHLKFSEWQNELAGRDVELDRLMVAAKKRIHYLEYMIPRAPEYLRVERKHLRKSRRERGSVSLSDAVQKTAGKIREFEDMIQNRAKELVEKMEELERCRMECEDVKDRSVEWMRCLEGLGWENYEVSQESRRWGLEGGGGDGYLKQDGPPQFPRPHGQLVNQQNYQRFIELYGPSPPHNGPPEHFHRRYGPSPLHIGQQDSLPPLQIGPPPAALEYGLPSLRGGLYSPPPPHNGHSLDAPQYDPSPLQNGQRYRPPPPQYGEQYAPPPLQNGQQYSPHQHPPVQQPLGRGMQQPLGYQPQHAAPPPPRLPASPAFATTQNVQQQTLLSGCTFPAGISFQQIYQGPGYQNVYYGDGPKQNDGPREGPRYPPQYGG